MYVCMYTCMYACIYVGRYICCPYFCVNAIMNVYVYVHVCICKYVCILDRATRLKVARSLKYTPIGLTSDTKAASYTSCCLTCRRFILYEYINIYLLHIYDICGTWLSVSID